MHLGATGVERPDPAGLPAEEAARRLAAEGPNEIPVAGRRGALAIAAGVAREPMFLLLLACGGLYLAAGDLGEALLLLFFVGVVMAITTVQERRTERAIEALKALASPRARVLRDGAVLTVAGREVVRGDLLVVAEGDRVPADARLLEGAGVEVDESLLTGESVPVRKAAGPAGPGPARPGGDDTPWLFSGTLVVGGAGRAEVAATGQRTEVGRIGRALRALEREPTPLQRQTARLVRIAAVAGIAVCLLTAAAYGLSRGDWPGAFLAGLSLAMAILPEELPVILTIFLALGAWRISRVKALTRSIPAVESLGAATVLCVDKTGTLTWNRMAVEEIRAGGTPLDAASLRPPLAGPAADLVAAALLATRPDAVDAMERAVRELAAMAGLSAAPAAPVREWPLSPALLAVARAVPLGDGGDALVAAKGAPEAIARLCRLGEAEAAALLSGVEEMGGRGLRVLAVARARLPSDRLPADLRAIRFEPLGLLGLADPVRPEVAGALAECYAAGIRTVMVTGDHPGTARAVARRIGLARPDGVATGPELERMDEAAFSARAAGTDVFARMVPEQKLRLVRALKLRGEVVAMTGDGVNDAPALKAAHIGVAMGGRGTDVAREAAAIVLLDDHFATIAAAVREGRRIYDNIRKAVRFTLAVHVPIAGLSLLPVLLGWPLALLPAHIVFLELVIDPVCSVVFEAEPAEPDLMRRPPRNLREPLLGRPGVVEGLIQGLAILAAALAVYGFYLRGHPEGTARALAFVTLVLGNLALVLSSRSPRPLHRVVRVPNPASWWVAAAAILLLALTVAVPALHPLFRFAPLHADDAAVAVGAALAVLGALELVKLGRRASRPGPADRSRA